MFMFVIKRPARFFSAADTPRRKHYSRISRAIRNGPGLLQSNPFALVSRPGRLELS